jgi:type I restriction enzyme S subunit
MNTETQNPACTPKPQNTNHLSEWREVKLGDLCTKIGSGATPRGGGESYKEFGVSLIRSQNVLDLKFSEDGLAFIDEIQANELKNVIVEKNDVLMNITGDSVARVCKVPTKILPARVNQHVAIIRSDENKLNSDFILYYLYNIKDYLLSISEIGATRKAITKNMIENLDILLPSLPEQQAIAEVLSSLDDKIDLLHRQNKTLEALAETLFRQWFIEEADERWEVVPLESFFDFLEGPGIRNWQYTETGTPFINIRLINNGDIDVSKANYISNEEANGKYSHFHLKEGDMVVSTSGTLGKTAIVRKYHLPLILNTSVIRFRPKDENNYSFMYQYLKSKLFQEHLESLASGSVQANFGPTHLKAMKIQKPSLDALKSYSAKADPLYSKLKSNQTQIRTLTQLRDTLLPKLMSGEVRVDF